MKAVTRWHSNRLGRDVTLARWGFVGKPVLLFPTAGGDAEECERFYVIDSLAELLKAGRIKVYSCDSVAGEVMMLAEGSPRYRSSLKNQFQEYVYHEVVPAIRSDCNSDDIEVISAGASIGAFNALSVLCRYPEAFSHALCLSGTFDLRRFNPDGVDENFYYASPTYYLPNLEEQHLETIRKRFVLLASGQGRAEDISASWAVAELLGSKGIPNRVDAWDESWHHDWPTWREMLPKYLAEFTENAD